MSQKVPFTWLSPITSDSCCSIPVLTMPPDAQWYLVLRWLLLEDSERLPDL